jgi:hypothetical protein
MCLNMMRWSAALKAPLKVCLVDVVKDYARLG